MDQFRDGMPVQHGGIDVDRLQEDQKYRESLARQVLDRCGQDADHVELRRAAVEVFPQIARASSDQTLALIIGHAATIRVKHEQMEESDVAEERLEMTPIEPLAYPDSYGGLDDDARALLVAFCEAALEAGREGPEALTDLMRRHGWPYSERTFYVGPWKAARLRARRRSDG